MNSAQIILLVVAILLTTITGCQTHTITTYYPPTEQFHTTRDGNVYGPVQSEERIIGANEFSNHKTLHVSAFN